MDFSRFFLRGAKGTLRLQNDIQFSYKGPWIPLSSARTLVDEWYLGDFMSAEYTVSVDSGLTRKEIIKALVVAGPSSGRATVYGRTNLGENLIDLEVEVDNSRLRLYAVPAQSPDGSTIDNSSLFLGGKLIYSSTYYYTITDIG
jgi:hypothetical protein